MDGDHRMNLFAYGTLMDPEIMTRVCGAVYRPQNAVLHDYVRRIVSGEVYPAVAHKEGQRVDGLVYFGLTIHAWDRLDRFEGDLYLRQAVTVIDDVDQPIDAQTYVIAEPYRHRLSEKAWDYAEFTKHNKQLFQTRYSGYRVLD